MEPRLLLEVSYSTAQQNFPLVEWGEVLLLTHFLELEKGRPSEKRGGPSPLETLTLDILVIPSPL